MTELNLANNASVTELPAGELCNTLTKIDLSNCSKLCTLPRDADLPALRRLDLENCASLPRFACGWHMPGLQHLNVSGCPAFDPRLLAPLKELRSLVFGVVPSSAVLPDLPHLLFLVVGTDVPIAEGDSFKRIADCELFDSVHDQESLQAVTVITASTTVYHILSLPDDDMPTRWLPQQNPRILKIWANEKQGSSGPLVLDITKRLALCEEISLRFTGDYNCDLGAKLLSNDGVRHLLRTSIRSITMRGYPFGEWMCSPVCRLLKDNNMLECLRFETCDLSVKAGEIIATMATCSALKTASFMHCEMSAGSGKALATSLANHGTLELLQVTHCKICELTPLLPLLCNPVLKRLDCRWNGPISPTVAGEIQACELRRRLCLDPKYEHLTVSLPLDVAKPLTYLERSDMQQLYAAENTIHRGRRMTSLDKFRGGPFPCVGTKHAQCRLEAMHHATCAGCLEFLASVFAFSNGRITKTSVYALKLAHQCRGLVAKCWCDACYILCRVGRLLPLELVPRIAFVPDLYTVPGLCARGTSPKPADSKSQPQKLTFADLSAIETEMEAVRGRGCPVLHCDAPPGVRVLATMGICERCFSFLDEHAEKLVQSTSTHPRNFPALFFSRTYNLLTTDAQKMRFKTALVIAQHHLERFALAKLAYGSPRMMCVAYAPDLLRLPPDGGLPFDLVNPHKDYPKQFIDLLYAEDPERAEGDVHVAYRVVSGLLIPVIDPNAFADCVDKFYEISFTAWLSYNHNKGETNITNLPQAILAALQDIALQCMNEMPPLLTDMPVVEDQLRIVLLPPTKRRGEVRLAMTCLPIRKMDKNDLRDRFVKLAPFLNDGIRRLDLPVRVMLRSTKWIVRHIMAGVDHTVYSAEHAAAKVAEKTPCPDVTQFVDTALVSVRKVLPFSIPPSKGQSWVTLFSQSLSAPYTGMVARAGELPPKGDEKRTQEMLRDDLSILFAHQNSDYRSSEDPPAEFMSRVANKMKIQRQMGKLGPVEQPVFRPRIDCSFLVRAHNGEPRQFNVTHWVALCGHVTQFNILSMPTPFFLLEVVPIFKQQGDSQTTLVLTVPPSELTREDLIQVANVCLPRIDSDRDHLVAALRTNSIDGFKRHLVAAKNVPLPTVSPPSVTAWSAEEEKLWMQAFSTTGIDPKKHAYVRKQAEVMLMQLHSSLRYYDRLRPVDMFIELPEHPISVTRMLLNSNLLRMQSSRPAAPVASQPADTSQRHPMEVYVSDIVGKVNCKQLPCMLKLASAKGTGEQFWACLDETMDTIWKAEMSRKLRDALVPFRGLDSGLMRAFWLTLTTCRHSPSCHGLDTLQVSAGVSSQELERHKAFKALWLAARDLMGLSFNVNFVVAACDHQSSVFDASVRADAWVMSALLTDPAIFQADCYFSFTTDNCTNPNEQLFPVLDRLAILQNDVFAGLTPITRLIVYLSAHGSASSSATAETQLTFTDSKPPYRTSLFDAKEFMRLLACLGGIYVGRFIILDCCNATGVFLHLRTSNMQVLELCSMNERLPLGMTRAFIVPALRSKPKCSRLQYGRCAECDMFFRLPDLHRGHYTFDGLAKWLHGHTSELVTFCGRLVRPVFKTNMGPMYLCRAPHSASSIILDNYGLTLLPFIDFDYTYYEAQLLDRAVRALTEHAIVRLPDLHGAEQSIRNLLCRFGLRDVPLEQIVAKVQQDQLADFLRDCPPNTLSIHCDDPSLEEHPLLNDWDTDEYAQVLEMWSQYSQRPCKPTISTAELLTQCGLDRLEPVLVGDLHWTDPEMVRFGLTVLRRHPDYRGRLMLALVRRGGCTTEAARLFETIIDGTHALSITIGIVPDDEQRAQIEANCASMQQLFQEDHCLGGSDVRSWATLQRLLACAAIVFKPAVLKVFASGCVSRSQHATEFLAGESGRIPADELIRLLECIRAQTTILFVDCPSPDKLIEPDAAFLGLAVVAVTDCDARYDQTDECVQTRLIEPLLASRDQAVLLADVVTCPGSRLLVCRGARMDTLVYDPLATRVRADRSTAVQCIHAIVEQNPHLAGSKQACLDLVASVALPLTRGVNYQTWMRQLTRNFNQSQEMAELMFKLYSLMRKETT